MPSIGSLFSGIGGLELGLEWAGFGPTIWQVERDDWCRGVLERHWPNAKRYTDVREVGAHNLQPADIICGGFPCQDVSSAGKGAGLSGARSGLWFEFLRVVSELRPAAVVVENVASGANRWVDECVAGLEGEGYHVLPVPLSAADCGAPHLRRRIFLVAVADSHIHGSGSRWSWGACSRGEGGRSVEPAGNAADAAQSGPQGAGVWGRSSGGCSDAADANGNGQHALPVDAEVGGAPASSGVRWAARRPPEPVLRGVDDGVSCGLDRVPRLRALGNAVVPQCGQVVGEVLRMLLGGGD